MRAASTRRTCARRGAAGGGGEKCSPRRRGRTFATAVVSLLLVAPPGAARGGEPPPATPGALPALDALPAPDSRPASATLTLEAAIRAGLAGNADLAARRAESGATGAARRAAETGRWPKVLTGADWRRSNNQVIVFSDKLTAGEFTAADFGLDSLNHPDPINHGVVSLGVEVPIDVAGRTGAGIDAARSAEAASAAGVRAAEIDLVARITEAYHGIGLADASVVVASQALDNARRSESVAAERSDRGAALRSDGLRARAARLERERDLDRRRADAALARARLALLMGAPGGQVIGTTEPPEEPAPDLGPLDSWLGDDAAARPDLEAVRRGADAAAASAAAARAARGPEMGGMARYEWNASGFDGGAGSYLVGLSVRWNAWDGGNAPRVDEAGARATAAAAHLRAAQDAVRLDVESAWRNAEVAGRSVAAAREGAAAAEEARRISAERYEAGLLPLTDLLQAETSALAARLAEIAARYDATVARVRLLESAGKLEVPR